MPRFVGPRQVCRNEMDAQGAFLLAISRGCFRDAGRFVMRPSSACHNFGRTRHGVKCVRPERTTVDSPRFQPGGWNEPQPVKSRRDDVGHSQITQRVLFRIRIAVRYLVLNMT